jgi:hypothetical protein
MVTMTLTEFNQNPSQATRLADVEDVLVLRRGQAAYRLSKVEPEPDPLDMMLLTGQATPPRATTPVAGALPVIGHDVDLGAALDADRRKNW